MKIKIFITSSILFAYVTCLFIYPDTISEFIKDSIYKCINIIVPSLFAFMSISKLLSTSDIAKIICRPFDFVFNLLLKLPKNSSFLFLISNIAGYPVGINILTDMVNNKQISKRSAEVMSIYCYNCGPAFYTATIGIAIFGNKKIGIILFLTSIISNFITAAIVNRIFKPNYNKNNTNFQFTSKLFVNCITDSGFTLIKMCIIIVFFSSVMGILHVCNFFNFIFSILNLDKDLRIIFLSLFEITNITQLNANSFRMIPYISAVCGFGGICVIMQIKASYNNSFSLKLFWKFIPLRLLLNFFISKILLSIFLDNYVAVSTKTQNIIVDFNNSIPSICLIMMILILVLKKDWNFKNKYDIIKK